VTKPEEAGSNMFNEITIEDLKKIKSEDRKIKKSGRQIIELKP
jgi:hypothetical protein